MNTFLSDDGLVSITEALDQQFPCRERQIRQLAHLLRPGQPSPSTLIVHGLHATGKTSILKSLLPALETPHAIIDSQECITARHLLERTVSLCEAAILTQPNGHSPHPSLSVAGSKCENMSMLTVHLQRLLEHIPSFTLVFDGIDRQREAPPTLLAALTRLGEFVPALTTVLILTVPRHRFLHSPGLPHIHFRAYSKSELLSIVAISPRPIFDPATSTPPSSSSEEAADAADSLYTWTRFTTAVYDSLARPSARDLVSFRALCDRLWPSFVAPIVAGDYGTRDFSKLIVAKRSLLRSEDGLVCSIIPTTSSTPVPFSSHTTAAAAAAKRHDLPYYSKLLLIAAYLASYNPARQDATYFMKAATDRKKKRQQRKSTAAGEAKHRKIARRLLGPQTFPLERLLAIFHAILPRDPPRSQTTNVDVQTQIATLSSLRLLTKTSNAADVLEGHTTKWRVNVGWDFVRNLGRGVGVEVEAWIGE